MNQHDNMDHPFFPSWSSYPSIFALGHRAVAELTKHEVYVQEKVDGSQFSFGVFDGEIRVRSKGAEMYPEAPEKMFQKAVDTVKRLSSSLIDGYTYRGEYLSKPRHNALAYDRVPEGNIILFDVTAKDGTFLEPLEVTHEAERLGLEVVRTFYTGIVTLEKIRELLDETSCLGGQKIEGVVLKPVGYSLFGVDKKVLMGKFVSEAFKEVHNATWKKDNPSQGDVVQLLIESYRQPARWAKAVQHLREAGTLQESPKDIGNLIKEVQDDVYKEEADEIKQRLFSHFYPQIKRALTAGLPEWYKESLLHSQFDESETPVVASNEQEPNEGT